MKIFNGILGTLAIFCALYCIFWPSESFLNAGWLAALVLGFWGICQVATFIIDKGRGKADGKMAGKGIFSLLLGIFAVVISILSMFNPDIQELFLLIILVVFIIFLFVNGIMNIIDAASRKKHKEKGAVLGIIIGIIELLAGIASIISWFFAANLIGIMIGVMLGIFGIALIASIFQHDNIDRLDAIVSEEDD